VAQEPVAKPGLLTEFIPTPTQPARIRHHPCWCDRQQCLTSETGIRHTSTPTYLTTGEQIFVMTLIQHDPDGEPELLIKVTETGDPDGLHLLTLPEIKAFAETLLIEYLKAAPLLTATAHDEIPANSVHARELRAAAPAAQKRVHPQAR
jgi:hypothetical protein